MNRAPGSAPAPERRAQQAALSTPFPAVPQAARVRVAVGGAVLVMGDARPVLSVAMRLCAEPSLRVLALIFGMEPASPRPRRLEVVRGRAAHVEGHLGSFQVAAHTANGHADLGSLSPNRSGLFDLIVDLNEPRLWPTEVTPRGYFAPAPGGADAEALAAALTALVGEAEKPRYVRFEPGLCTHGARGLRGCARCLEVCPTRAITSAGTRVSVDAHLCQGCGTCAAVCPTGALDATELPGAHLRRRIGLMLDAYRAAGGTEPRVVLHRPGRGAELVHSLLPALDPTVLPVEVPALAFAGMDAWLGALALGAHEVILVEAGESAPRSLSVLESELETARAVLGALGLAPDRVRLVARDHAAALARRRGEPVAARTAAPESGASKRAAIEAFLRHLGARPGTSAERVALAPGAPFGRVVVAAQTCTLCQACSHLCPTAALEAGDGGRALRFTESACVQCGLCERGCPEKAIRLEPSFDADLRARAERALLCEGDQAHCSRCGAAFMPRALLAASRARLGAAGEPGERSANVLDLCPRCRADATLSASFAGLMPRA